MKIYEIHSYYGNILFRGRDRGAAEAYKESYDSRQHWGRFCTLEVKEV